MPCAAMPCRTEASRARPGRTMPCYSFPDEISPVWRDHPVAESIRYHSAVPDIRTEHVTLPTEGPQIRDLVRTELPAPNMVNVAVRQRESLQTAHAPTSVPPPH